MRQIKFRAWDKGKKEMRTVTGISWYDEYIWVDETPMSGDRFPIESTPIMQFTGLKDKNGKDIYEGDIVKDNLGNISVIEYATHTGCCCPNTIGFMLSESNIDSSNRECKIIGNIYEHHELLK